VTFVLRPPTAHDAERVAAVHVSAWREAYAHLLPVGFFDDAHVRIRREMWAQNLGSSVDAWTIRIGERGGRLVGFATAGPSGAGGNAEPVRARQLYNLYVLRAEYGTGLGQALLDEVLGDESAELWVAERNPRAITFYRRNGFEFDGARHVDADLPAMASVRMIR